MNLSWAAGSGNTSFAVGGKYKIDDGASFSVSWLLLKFDH